MDGDDDLLVVRATGGDADAFAALLRRHAEPAAALVRRLVPAADREDVWQETLISVWCGLSALRDGTKVRAWLVQVARHRCLDHLRRTRQLPEPTPDEALELTMATAAGQRRRWHELRDEAVTALEALPEPLREAARRFYLDGWSIGQIAASGGCPEGTVRRRLHAARGRLRRELKENGDE